MDNYSALVSDSRQVVKDCLFFCKGNNFKTEYLDIAIEKGAKAYVSEKDYGARIPCILVPDIRRAMASYAKEFYSDPSASLKLIGITGTKGKSTSLYFLKSIMESWEGCKEGRFGYTSSIDNYDGITLCESHLTTPESLELNLLLSNMVRSGIVYAGMEVSSQALKYDRSWGLRYVSGGFTNFSEDHISPVEHSDIEDYFSSKLKLISQCDSFIVNLNADRGDLVLAACADEKKKGNLKKIIAIKNESLDTDNIPFISDVDEIYVISDVKKENGNTLFSLSSFGRLKLSMPGLFNIENACFAAVFARELGADDESVSRGLFHAKASGRMEIYKDSERNIVGIVDFAHNEFAFENIFSSARQEYPGYTVKAVFGCCGNKAYERRTGMPRAAAKYADYCYITEDDPYMEDPLDICKEVLSNLEKFGGKGEIVVDREKAIRKAVSSAEENTVLLFLAKGKDTYMHRKEFDPYISDSVLAEMLLCKKEG